MSGDHPGFSQARDRRQILVAALALGVALLAPPLISALRGPSTSSVAPPGSSSTTSSTGPSTSGSTPTGAPVPSVVHLAATATPGAARVTLDGDDLGLATLDPKDGGIRGEALIRLGASASGLSGVHVTITRDPTVPQALADGLQRLLAMDGALDTVVVEPR